MYTLFKDSGDDDETYAILDKKTNCAACWFYTLDDINHINFDTEITFKELKTDAYGKLILVGTFPEIPTIDYLKSNYPELLI